MVVTSPGGSAQKVTVPSRISTENLARGIWQLLFIILSPIMFSRSFVQGPEPKKTKYIEVIDELIEKNNRENNRVRKLGKKGRKPNSMLKKQRKLRKEVIMSGKQIISGESNKKNKIFGRMSGITRKGRGWRCVPGRWVGKKKVLKNILIDLKRQIVT